MLTNIVIFSQKNGLPYTYTHAVREGEEKKGKERKFSKHKVPTG